MVAPVSALMEFVLAPTTAFVEFLVAPASALVELMVAPEVKGCMVRMSTWGVHVTRTQHLG